MTRACRVRWPPGWGQRPAAGLDNGLDYRFAGGCNGGGNTHTLTTPAGKLTVTGVSAQSQTQSVNMRTCYISFTIRQQFKFVPGQSTGKFAGASGPGAYQVYFAAYAPRFTSGKHKGQCDTACNVQPLAQGAVPSFLAAGVLSSADEASRSFAIAAGSCRWRQRASVRPADGAIGWGSRRTVGAIGMLHEGRG